MRFAFALVMSVGCLVAEKSTAAVAGPAASDSGHERLYATEVRIAVGDSGRLVDLKELSGVSVEAFERLTGKKMGWMRKLAFGLALRKLRHRIKSDGTIDLRQVRDGHFHLGGLMLGVCLNVYGIPIAYLIHDEKRHRRIKWAWIGLAIFDTVLGALFVTFAARKRDN